MSSNRRAADDAVSSVIGTVLALAVSVSGLGLTMLLGAPMMKRMDDQAAIEAAVGRFDALQDAVWRLAVAHEGLSVPMDPLGGSISIENGTRILVAMGLDGGEAASESVCDVDVKDWADGDRSFEVVTTCKEPRKRGSGQTEGRANPHAKGATKEKNANHHGGRSGNGNKCGQGQSACLQAYAIPDYGTDHIDNISTQANRVIVELDRDLAGSEWMFHLTSEVGAAGLTTYAYVWILDQSRLHWNRPGPGGGVDAMLEGGAMFSNAGDVDRLESPLPVAEDGAGGGTYFLRLVSMDTKGFGPGTTASSTQLFLALSDGFIRAHEDEVDSLRFAFAGTLGDAWCHAFVERNGGFGMPAGHAYQAQSSCITGDPDDNGVRSVRYGPVDSSGSFVDAPFPVVFAEVVLDVQLNP